jgi:ribosomal protein L37AE/L43A
MTALRATTAELNTARTCPLCHTEDPTITNEALIAGGAWGCVRCGQTWSAARIATAAAYADYVAASVTDAR